MIAIGRLFRSKICIASEVERTAFRKRDTSAVYSAQYAGRGERQLRESLGSQDFMAADMQYVDTEED